MIIENEEKKIKAASRELIEYLINHPNIEKRKITQIKNKILKKYKSLKTLKNSQILSYANENELKTILPLLRRRSTRTISGVTVVAVMTKPFKCPGKCIYCPGEESQPDQKVAKSYTGHEPAAKRSIMFDYDSYLQTKHRLLDQKSIGHQVDKIDLIIMGGTFLATPENYQIDFIKGCYDAIINFYEPNFNNDKKTIDFKEAKKIAETSKLRLIGLTIETRPDYCKIEHINKMLYYGTTRVEIGVQTTRSSILSKLNRGHTIEDTINAFKWAKDAGLKINAHMMPNLPYSTPEEDLNDFKNLFENPNFRPDMLKIYPTLVVKGTKLYDMWKKGEYKPYDLDILIDLIAKIKMQIPKYVRIQRIQRDIPANLIIAGVKKSNLRQIVQKYMNELGLKCNCIRCREQGFINEMNRKLGLSKSINFEEYILKRIDYEASEGKEIFLSFENDEWLIGYLRLRIPSQDVFRLELKPKNNKPVGIVREIKIVGEIVPRNAKPQSNQIQHRGFGKRLLREAEKIAKEEFNAYKISVIAGIGVREYFYKLGYYLDGVYVSKYLK
ncbi:MAG: tRNA uridine(34) 5-carboxymethylaminomethyl modification radical SAM/GNAT enzyme Elp3 [Promethearchaeota archaeon]